jgi:hypothetical protein
LSKIGTVEVYLAGLEDLDIFPWALKNHKFF